MDPDWIYKWKNAPADLPGELVEALEIEFKTGLLESAVCAHPGKPELLFELGECYTRQGRYEEGLAVDLKLARLLPDNPTVQYNLACSFALTGQPEKAVKALHRAVMKGFNEFDLMETDEDLSSIRDLPEFQSLVERARKALS